MSENKDSQSKPWDITALPNWGRHWVEEVSVDALDRHSFQKYIAAWKPVVVRGACRSWPAVSRWADRNYLHSNWGATQVPIWTKPNPQMSGGAEVERVRKEAWHAGTFAEILGDVAGFPDMSVRFFPLQDSPLSSMSADLGIDPLTVGFPPPRMYSRLRLFAYRGGVSLWHAHPTDEHFTYQIVGKKRFALLGPHESHPIARITNRELYSFGVDGRKYPEYSTMAPSCCELGAGDAIYIPPMWWHTVQPSDYEFGATVASTWASRIGTHLRHLHHWVRPAFRPVLAVGAKRIPVALRSLLRSSKN